FRRPPEFVKSFVGQKILLRRLTHDRTWKESEEIVSVVRERFTLLEEIWINLAFNSELAKSLRNIILLSILAILKNLPSRLFSFIITSERQSIASSDRKGEGQGRKPDIMFMANI
ncbi:11473_t:CDS:1, partial [Dentiscutata heterogama]